MYSPVSWLNAPVRKPQKLIRKFRPDLIKQSCLFIYQLVRNIDYESVIFRPKVFSQQQWASIHLNRYKQVHESKRHSHVKTRFAPAQRLGCCITGISTRCLSSTSALQHINKLTVTGIFGVEGHYSSKRIEQVDRLFLLLFCVCKNTQRQTCPVSTEVK